MWFRRGRPRTFAVRPAAKAKVPQPSQLKAAVSGQPETRLFLLCGFPRPHAYAGLCRTAGPHHIETRRQNVRFGQESSPWKC